MIPGRRRASATAVAAAPDPDRVPPPGPVPAEELTGLACRAPWTALHFDPHGWVRACTANKRDVLGHVGRSTLAEIWAGAAVAQLRRAVAGGALGVGCELCRWQRSSSGSSAMYARLYDEGEPAPALTGPVHLEFAISNRCNLACTMCNGAYSSTIRHRREGLPALPVAYPDRFYDELAALTPQLARAKFLGGEPLLGSENFRIWERWAADGASVACHVTTNGTVWTDRLATLLEALPMSFAVSLDGATPATVERIRVGASYDAILANVDRFCDHAQRHGTDVSLTYCLMVDNWHELADFLLLADRLGVAAFVNSVLSPSRLSLYHLPPAELAAIVEALERRSDEVVGLHRNGTVWTEQLERLRSAVAAPVSSADVPVHLPTFSPPSDVPAAVERAPEAPDPPTWGDDPARLRVAADGRIAEVDPGHLGPLALDRLRGAGIDELYLWLISAFGRPAGGEQRHRSRSHGDRVVRFADASTATSVRLVSEADEHGGARWQVWTHREDR